MNEKTKKEIDGFSYMSMLRLWRFAPSGTHYFIGDTGKYFTKIMKEKEEKLQPGEKVGISKEIGW